MEQTTGRKITQVNIFQLFEKYIRFLFKSSDSINISKMGLCWPWSFVFQSLWLISYNSAESYSHFSSLSKDTTWPFSFTKCSISSLKAEAHFNTVSRVSHWTSIWCETSRHSASVYAKNYLMLRWCSPWDWMKYTTDMTTFISRSNFKVFYGWYNVVLC
jgi:hypothetical protein